MDMNDKDKQIHLFNNKVSLITAITKISFFSDMLKRPMPMTQADGTLFRRRAVPLPISKRSSPLLSAKASFRRLGSSQRRTLRGR